MKLFFRAEKTDVAKSKELSGKLKALNPKANDAEIQKVNETILEKYEEFERALKLRDAEKVWDLRFMIERLNGKKSDLQQQSWRERNSIITELGLLNKPILEHCLEWIGKGIRELDDARNIEEIARTTNPYTLAVTYKIKTNFVKVEGLVASLVDAQKKIRGMAASGSIDQIEKIYLDVIETIPSSVPCDQELDCSEDEFWVLKEQITTGMVRKDFDALWSYRRYGEGPLI